MHMVHSNHINTPHSVDHHEASGFHTANDHALTSTHSILTEAPNPPVEK
jgi:hypothetical protein